MKHNVNFGLLGLLLLVVVAMIGLVIYYYTTYEGLSSKYDEALLSLENISAQVNRTQYELLAKEQQLNEKEKVLLEYLGELNISKQRESSLGSHFNDLKGEVTDLSTDLNSTILERNKYAVQADRYYADSLEWKGKYDGANSDLNTANNKIGRMKGDAVELTSALNLMDNELISLRSRIVEIDDLASDIRSATNATSEVKSLSGDVKSEVGSAKSTLSAMESQMGRLFNLINSIKGS